MFRKVIISCLAAFGLVACHASARVGSVHAAGGVHHDHR
jgi:hypothetical protein